MKKYSNGDNGIGITTRVNQKSLIIDIPIELLKTAFIYCPDNYDGTIIKPRKTRAFADLIARHLFDETDSETGTNHIHTMLDSVFNEIFEGNIDTENIIKFLDDNEDYE